MLRKLLGLLFLALPIFAQIQGNYTGNCEQGNNTVSTATITSATTVKQSFPACTVAVNITGGANGLVSTNGTTVTWLDGTLFNGNTGNWAGLTININSVPYVISSTTSSTALTLTSSAGIQTDVAYSIATAPAPIFVALLGTPKANPFTANADGSFSFYPATPYFDIILSGGIAPNSIITPFTLGAQNQANPLSNSIISDDWYYIAGLPLSTACTTARLRNATLTITHKWLNLSNQTLTCNISIINSGALLQPASGQIVTLSGTFNSPDSPTLDTTAGGKFVLPGVLHVQWFVGATADVQLNACLNSSPASGGTCDATGYGATTQTIAATVTIGNLSTPTPYRIEHLIISRNTNFNVTITNNTNAFLLNGGSSFVGNGETEPLNVGAINLANSASVSNVIEVFNGVVGGVGIGGYDLRGITIGSNSSATVSNAAVWLASPNQIGTTRAVAVGGFTDVPLFLVTDATGGVGGSSFVLDNNEADCAGITGCIPLLIKSVAGGGGINGMSIRSGTYVHPGTGLASIYCDGSAGAGVFQVDITDVVVESTHNTDLGVELAGCFQVTIENLFASAVVPGLTVLKLDNDTLQALRVTGLVNFNGWTNNIVNSLNSTTYSYATYGTFMPLYTYTSNAYSGAINDGSTMSGIEPTTTLGTGAGAGATCYSGTDTNCLVAGSDRRRGSIWITIGTSPASDADIFTFVWPTAFGQGPFCQIEFSGVGLDENIASTMGPNLVNSTTVTYHIWEGSNLFVPGNSYRFNYSC